jgi:hypothetical protein
MLLAAFGSFLDPTPASLNCHQAGGFKVASKVRIFFPPIVQSFDTDVASLSCEVDWQTGPGDLKIRFTTVAVFLGGRPRGALR